MKFIMNIFNSYGIIVLFILIALEYACFPIPSEIVLPFVGFVANLNQYSLFGVVFFSVITGYMGSLFCYLVGYYGGNYIYNKIYKKFVRCRKGLDKAQQIFCKYGGVSVLCCRVIPLCRTYVSFFAGMFKQSLFKYSLFSIIGIFIWNMCLIVSGYMLFNKWGNIIVYFNAYKSLLLVIIGFFIIMFLIYKLYKKIKFVKTMNGD